MNSLKQFNGKHTLGLVTARKGSKGIPGKNIRSLCGKPLVTYTLEAAMDSHHLSRCVVSTDDEELATLAKDHGAEVPFMRPAALAQDESLQISVVQHALEWIRKNEGVEYDYVMILQPTSPLRIARDIDACIEKIVHTGADSVMSVMELEDFAIKKLLKIEDDRLSALLPDFSEAKIPTPRQSLGRVYKRNCAVYLSKTECIARGEYFGQTCLPYLMPVERSVDINRPVDFDLAEFWLRKMHAVQGA